uniref:Olfactory receptor n=1 Tax=Leptobrachium leishanense TaxID=445787 RepID=A0A8C5Q4I5_9ANUR
MNLFWQNKSFVHEFIFQGFSVSEKSQLFIFVVILNIYLFTLFGNLLIVSLVCLCPSIQNPMYIFLGNFSFTEICYTTVIIPQILVHTQQERKVISYIRCLLQLYFLGPTEFFLLTVMAYDRYAAICSPLRYSYIMNEKVCQHLAVVSWMSGFFTGWTLTIPTAMLNFCGPNVINHFFCDFVPLVKLSCSDTSVSETVFFSLAWVVVLSSLSFSTISYSFIIKTILKIPSSLGRQKAFSTCAAHLTVLIIFYGTCIFLYVRPRASFLSDKDKILSLIYSVITPCLNPLIYTLRNREFKQALIKHRHLLLLQWYLRFTKEKSIEQQENLHC